MDHRGSTVSAAAGARTIGELNAFVQLLPNIDFFIRMYVAKEATQSSRIEGTQTTIVDALKDAEDLSPEDRDDWGEVQNYIKAINFAIDSLERIPLSNRLLRETHAILLQGVRGQTKQPGGFRRSQNWIGVSLKNAVCVPPHHEHDARIDERHGEVPPQRQGRDSPAHQNRHCSLSIRNDPPVPRRQWAFGALMISLYLASEKLLVKPALYLSDYFERNKTAYVDHLMSVRQGHHMRDWLMLFLHGAEETARASITVLREILVLKERIEQEVMPRLRHRRQEKFTN